MSEYRKPMRAPAARRGWRLLTVGVVGGVIAAGMIMGTGSSAASAPPFNAHLTRAPYLTDLVGLQVAINFATDRSASSASVSYGPESDGGCALTSAFAPTRTPIMVGTVAEYQWTAALTLPAAGRYCYRVYLAGADLLAGAPSPSFATQVLPGDPTPVIFDVLGDWGQVGTDGTNPDQANLMEQIASSGARFAVTVGDNGYPNGSQINYGDLQQVGANTSAIFGPDFWTVPGSSVPLFVVAGNHGETGTQHTDLTTWTQHAAVTE